MTKRQEHTHSLTRDEAIALRDKFMDGHTTPEEEQMLREWSGNAAPAEEWELCRLLLSPLPEEEDKEDLMAADYTADYDRIVSLRRRRSLRIFLSRIAAVVVVALGTGAFFLSTNNRTSLTENSAQTATSLYSPRHPDITPAPSASPNIPVPIQKEKRTTKKPSEKPACSAAAVVDSVVPPPLPETAGELETISDVMLCITAADIHAINHNLLTESNGTDIVTNTTY